MDADRRTHTRCRKLYDDEYEELEQDRTDRDELIQRLMYEPRAMAAHDQLAHQIIETTHDYLHRQQRTRIFGSDSYATSSSRGPHGKT